MKMAVFRRSCGPRVKIAPCTRSRTCLRFDPAVLQQLIHSRVDRHHGIKDARVPVAVEISAIRIPLGSGLVTAQKALEGMLGSLSLPATTSAALGLPVIAFLIASLVAS